MTERGFHPFAVLHFLRKTILLYLLPLLQVLFARNWAALRTALVQGAALLTVLAAVSAAVLHAGRWRVDAQGTPVSYTHLYVYFTVFPSPASMYRLPIVSNHF